VSLGVVSMPVLDGGRGVRGQGKGENGFFVQGMQGETHIVQFLVKYGAKV